MYSFFQNTLDAMNKYIIKILDATLAYTKTVICARSIDACALEHGAATHAARWIGLWFPIISCVEFTLIQACERVSNEGLLCISIGHVYSMNIPATS